MSFQPDFILEFAHYLGEYYSQKGLKIFIFLQIVMLLQWKEKPKIYRSNLLGAKRGFKNKSWILPFNDEIKVFSIILFSVIFGQDNISVLIDDKSIDDKKNQSFNIYNSEY